MKSIPFWKYEAAGNDFVLLEGSSSLLSLERLDVPMLCDRRRGVGADGIILFDQGSVCFVNCDGSQAAACGNGLRVAALHNRKKRRHPFEVSSDSYLHSLLGVHQWKEDELKGEFSVTYPDPSIYHQVHFVENPEEIHHPPLEVNRNYIQIKSRRSILIKTIERGVGETPSCGTGSIAAFIESRKRGLVDPEVHFLFTSGQELFVKEDEQGLYWLRGKVRLVFEGSWK